MEKKKVAAKKATPDKKPATKAPAKKAAKKKPAPAQTELALASAEDTGEAEPVNVSKQKNAPHPQLAEAREILRGVAIAGRKLALELVVKRLNVPAWVASRAYADEVAAVRSSLGLPPTRTRAKSA